MGRRSVASRAAGEVSRRKMGKSSIGSIYRQKSLQRYPGCAGMMPECPAAIEDPRNPPDKCARCPHFMESPFYKKPSTDEKIMELRNLFEQFRKK